MRKSSILFISFLLILFSFNCDNNTGSSTSKEIGPEGGTITTRDGRLTLIFPPGALSETTKITITEIEPVELPAELEGITVTYAYELEPDGIVFNVPVTARFITDESPVQGDGGISTEGALLLTSTGGEFEILDNLVVEIDGDENTTTASADLNHFSPLIVTRGIVVVSVSGVPDSAAVNVPFNAMVSVATGDEDMGDRPLYEDKSKSPIVIDFPSASKLPFVPGKFNEARGVLPYHCIELGMIGIYASKITVLLPHPLVPAYVPVTYLLDKPVECLLFVEPPPVQPTPQPSPSPEPSPPSPEPSPAPELCAKVGSYQSAPPPTDECGIGSFILNINAEGKLALSGFKDNAGQVIFNMSDDPTIFFSASNELTIFGVGGHSCDLVCGPGENVLTLKCVRPGAMCTEVFTLQQ